MNRMVLEIWEMILASTDRTVDGMIWAPVGRRGCSCCEDCAMLPLALNLIFYQRATSDGRVQYRVPLLILLRLQVAVAIPMRMAP